MLPDDGDPSQRRRLERERAVVAQEDGRLGAGAAEKLEILRAGGNRRDVRCRRDECANSVVGAQKATDGHVEVVFFDPSVVDGRDDGGPQRSTRSGHLEIEAGPQRKARVGHCEPIGHDETFETPFTSYEVDQELPSLGQPPPVQAVVGRHEPEGTALTDGDLKGQEIELSQRSLVDDRTDAAPLELRFVPDEVFHRGEHACRLHAAHVSGGQASGEKRILRIALEIAPGERVTGAGSPSGPTNRGTRDREPLDRRARRAAPQEPDPTSLLWRTRTGCTSTSDRSCPAGSDHAHRSGHRSLRPSGGPPSRWQPW